MGKVEIISLTMVEEHIHEHHDGGNGAYTFLAFIVALVIIGLLLWRFLPSRGSSTKGIDVNVSGGTSGGTGQSY